MSSMRWLMSLTLVWALMPVAAATGQSFVGQLRKEVREPAPPAPPEPKPQKKKKCYDDDDCDDDDNPLFDGIGEMLLIGVTSPLWGPMMMAGESNAEQLYFPAHPYSDDHLGYMTWDDPTSHPTGPYAMRIRGDYGYDLNDTSLFGGQLLFETVDRWGFDTEARYWRENVGVGRHEQLWSGDANLVYRFAQSPWLQMRAGGGVNWISDHFGSDFGFNFTYGGEWFPADPWVVSGELDWGRLGETSVLHLRSTLGIQISSVELYSGYDYFAAGDARNHGLITGLRLWY